MFDHFQNTVTIGDDPAIALRIVGFEREHDDGRGIGRVEPVDHHLHCHGRHEWHVAIKDQDITIKARQRSLGLLNGMTRPVLWLLQREFSVPRQRGLKLFLATPHHHNLACRVQRIDALHEMHQHRTTRNRVQYLVQVGFHARALPSGKDDGGNISHPDALALRHLVNK